ncbi:RteC domain-containing protein [Chitinophaga pollutisoli]|uniref:RteC domain-containing protein n=1 Tax=Chitinophaga pollutisoli TaxID=3133966 RepID=A0ABZ2YRS8_9BACT
MDQQRQYIADTLHEITAYRRQHPEAYRYFTLSSTTQDEQLFIPPTNGAPMFLYDWMVPHLPFTPYTFHFANFLAGKWLTDWIEQYFTHPPSLQQRHAPLKWTGTLAALTEMIYALNEMGVLGSGRQEINKVKVAFEKFFNTSIGNIYKSYEHNRIRKKAERHFLMP